MTGDPLGTHGRHDRFGGEFQEIEQSLPILGLLIHAHITVHEMAPLLYVFFVMSTMVTLWGHMVVTTISGGAHPEIEPTVPIMALLIYEHMTVQGKTPTQDIQNINKKQTVPVKL